MDILYQLSNLFYQDAEDLQDKDPEYQNLRRLEGRFFEQVPEELREKIYDVQTEIEYHALLRSFLYGLRVGFAAAELRS